jgi:hypothetical protein
MTTERISIPRHEAEREQHTTAHFDADAEDRRRGGRQEAHRIFVRRQVQGGVPMGELEHTGDKEDFREREADEKIHLGPHQSVQHAERKIGARTSETHAAGHPGRVI